MKNKLSLAIAAATVSLAALTGSVMILSDRASAQDDGTALSDGDKAFLKVVPMSPGPETAGLVPHAGPEEAAAVAKAFFDTPWPSDVELAAIAPFDGTENVPQSLCTEHEPAAAKNELKLAPGSIERRMKGEIYGFLKLSNVLATRDCTCRGKVVAYEPVPIILRELVGKNGPLSWLQVDELRDENLRLLRTVEHVCGGSFL